MGGEEGAHRAEHTPVTDPIVGEDAERQPSAAAKPGRRVRSRRARVALREGAPQERAPELLGGKRAVLAVETTHVGAAVDQARARLRREHLGDDQQDLARQEKWDGEPRRRRRLECRTHAAPAGGRAAVEGAHHHGVVHHAYGHGDEHPKTRKRECCQRPPLYDALLPLVGNDGSPPESRFSGEVGRQAANQGPPRLVQLRKEKKKRVLMTELMLFYSKLLICRG